MKTDDQSTDVADRVHSLRGRLGLTQGQFADLLGVTLVTISRWENRQVRPNRIALKSLSALAEIKPMMRGDATRRPNSAAELQQVLARKAASKMWAASRPVPNLKARPVERVVPGAELSEDCEGVAPLKKSRVFAGLSDEEYAQFARIGVALHLRPGQFLFSEGDRLHCLYVVTQGRFKILKHSPSGRDFILAFSGPGEILGNISLLSGKPHPTSAQAVVETRALAFTDADFLAFLSCHAELGFKIFRRMLISLGDRFEGGIARLADLAVERSDHRLACILLTLSLKFGSTLPLTREEIAQMAGTTSETVVRFVNRMKRLGIVRPLRRKIIILDRIKLEGMLGGRTIPVGV